MKKIIHYIFLILVGLSAESFQGKAICQSFYENDTSNLNYPSFSWDHVPLYMHMRKSTAFTQEELEYLAGFPIITLEKTTGSTTYGSSEKGSREAAKGIKAINPDARVLYYRNVMVNYSTYDVNAGLDTIPGAFLEDGTGNTLLHQGVREVYDISNPILRKWWVDHCVEMAGYEEIDGIFIDGNVKAITPTYLLAEIGGGKKLATMEGYDLMMEDLEQRMDSSKLKLANLIRATLPESGLEYMHYFNGSYMEGIEGDKDYIAKGIAAAQTAAREGKIICFSIQFSDALPASLPSDENGILILDKALQERMNYCLAMFLICAEQYSYFLVHDGYNVNPGVSALWMTRFAEYDKSLGPPSGTAVKNGYYYTREFEHASVWLDLNQGKGSITWDSDTVPDHDPDPDPDPDSITTEFTLKFIIHEANSPVFVADALISLDSLTGATNLAGEKVFSLDSGRYEYQIDKNGFFSVDSMINIHSDTIVYITMKGCFADVRFRIKQLDTPVGKVYISVDGDSLQTNTVGLATFYDLPVYRDYSYTISKPGYESISGFFSLEKDTTIEIQLNTLTYVNPYNNDQLLVYPNPAENYLVLESVSEIMEVCLFDLNGRLIFSDNDCGNYIRRELPFAKESIYLIKVLLSNGSEVTEKIVIF